MYSPVDKVWVVPPESAAAWVALALLLAAVTVRTTYDVYCACPLGIYAARKLKLTAPAVDVRFRLFQSGLVDSDESHRILGGGVQQPNKKSPLSRAASNDSMGEPSWRSSLLVHDRSSGPRSCCSADRRGRG